MQKQKLPPNVKNLTPLHKQNKQYQLKIQPSIEERMSWGRSWRCHNLQAEQNGGKCILKSKSWREGNLKRRIKRKLEAIDTCRSHSEDDMDEYQHGGHQKWMGWLEWWVLSSATLRYSTDSHSLIQLPPNPISLRILINIAQEGDDDGDEDPGLEWWRWWQGWMMDRLEDDGWMVDGSGSWMVDTKWRWCGYQMKEENRGSQVNQQSRELVVEWVRYEGLKVETLKLDWV